MNKTVPFALVFVAALCVIGVVICAVTSVTVPGVLGDLAFSAIGGAAGAAIPTHDHTITP